MKKSYVLGVTIITLMMGLTLMACNKETAPIETVMEFSVETVEEVSSDVDTDNAVETDVQEAQSEVVAEETEVIQGEQEAYQQQLAEEYGTTMPSDASITMIAKSKCNIRSEASTNSSVIGSLSKGDSIKVTEVGEWNKVELDDGTEGYVRSDLLSDATDSTQNTAENGATNSNGGSTSNGNGSGNGNSGGNSGTGNNGNTSNSQGSSTGNNNSNTSGNANGSAGTSTPAPEPSNSGAANPSLTDDELMRILLEAGATTGGDPTGNTEVIHTDPNAAANAGIDTSGVTLH